MALYLHKENRNEGIWSAEDNCIYERVYHVVRSDGGTVYFCLFNYNSFMQRKHSLVLIKQCYKC